MELYEVVYLNKAYFFTNNSEDIKINGILYKAIPISRNEIDMSIDKNGAEVIAPIDVPPFAYLVLNAVIDLPTIKIIKYPEMFVIYDGKIVHSEFSYERRTAKLVLGFKYSLKEAEIPKKSYSRFCPFNFCDSKCGLSLSNYSVVSYSFVLNGTNLILNDYTSLPFKATGGYIETAKDEKQYIVKQNNNVLVLLKPLLFTDIDYIRVYGGCGKTIEDCRNYNNLNNFGGFPCIPEKNIFTEGF